MPGFGVGVGVPTNAFVPVPSDHQCGWAGGSPQGNEFVFNIPPSSGGYLLVWAGFHSDGPANPNSRGSIHINGQPFAYWNNDFPVVHHNPLQNPNIPNHVGERRFDIPPQFLGGGGQMRVHFKYEGGNQALAIFRVQLMVMAPQTSRRIEPDHQGGFAGGANRGNEFVFNVPPSRGGHLLVWAGFHADGPANPDSRGSIHLNGQPIAYWNNDFPIVHHKPWENPNIPSHVGERRYDIPPQFLGGGGQMRVHFKYESGNLGFCIFRVQLVVD